MKKIMAVVLVLVLCLSVFAGCVGERNAARTTDVKALLNNTVKQLAAETEAAEKSLYGFVPSEEEGYAELSVKASGLNLPVDNSFTLNSLAANIVASVSEKKNEAELKINGNVNETEINLFEMLWNDEAISVKSPSLLDNTFALPVQDFSQKWNSSAFGSEYPITKEIPSIALSEYFKALKEEKEAGEALLNLTADFLENANQGNEETTLLINGKETGVTKFTMVVTKESMKNYFASWTEYLVSAMKTTGIRDTEYEEILEEAKEEINAELDALEFENVTFFIYGYKSKIIRAEWSGVVNDETVLFYIQFNDPDHLTNSMEIVLETEDAEGISSLSLTADSNIEKGGDKIFAKISAQANDYGTVTALASAEMNMDYSQGTYNIKLEIVEEAAVDISGTCKKGKEFEMTIDDVVVNTSYSTVSLQDFVKAELGGEVDILIKASPDSKDIELTQTSKTTDVFTMTEADLYTIQNELMSNVIKIAADLGISLY